MMIVVHEEGENPVNYYDDGHALHKEEFDYILD